MSRGPQAAVLDDAPGPFRAVDVAPGSRYELYDGHPVYCAPTGGDRASRIVVGAEVLDTDPAVEEAGVDPGYTTGTKKLHAPDVAVGNVPDQPGWIAGVPPLAVEYAGSGQDESKLQEKIAILLQAGTRWVWVVRLLGPRRVEVHTRGEAVRTFGQGEELRAPGVLQNPVKVEELIDRRAAHAATLRNLLQRQGYADLEAVREEGREEGRGTAVLTVLAARGIAVPDEVRGRSLGCRDGAQVDAWRGRAARADQLSDVLG